MTIQNNTFESKLQTKKIEVQSHLKKINLNNLPAKETRNEHHKSVIFASQELETQTKSTPEYSYRFPKNNIKTFTNNFSQYGAINFQKALNSIRETRQTAWVPKKQSTIRT